MKPIPAVEKRTVFPLTGGGDLGFVTDEIAKVTGYNPGPIKLLRGVEGRNSGFGEAHIAARRLKQIAQLGYTIVAYVKFVVSDFDAILKQPDGRLKFVRKAGAYYHYVICQWDEELKVWSTTTALPKAVFRDEKDIIWRKT